MVCFLSKLNRGSHNSSELHVEQAQLSLGLYPHGSLEGACERLVGGQWLPQCKWVSSVRLQKQLGIRGFSLCISLKLANTKLANERAHHPEESVREDAVDDAGEDVTLLNPPYGEDECEEGEEAK